jgi:hypothetical protein
MSVSPLAASAGVALAALAAKATGTLSQSLSFLDVLHLGGASNDAAGSDVDKVATASTQDDSEVSAATLRSAAETALQSFRELVGQRLAAAGIDVSRPIRLEADERGRIFVAGDHPQRAQIEQIFSDDAELGAALNHLSSTFHALQRAQKNQAFEDLYALDPQNAAARLSSHDRSTGRTFTLLLQGDEVQVGFE